MKNWIKTMFQKFQLSSLNDCFRFSIGDESRKTNKLYNKRGNTAVHEAVINDNLKEFKMLVKNGEDVNRESIPYGWSPLHIAVSNFNVIMVKNLIESGANINQKNKEGNTPLHIALSTRLLNSSVLYLLLKNDADLHEKNNKNITPFEQISSDERKKSVIKRIMDELD